MPTVTLSLLLDAHMALGNLCMYSCTHSLARVCLIVFPLFASSSSSCVHIQVGDRLDTDMLFGMDNGLQTVLTLSGVTTEEKLLSPENKIVPDQYVNSIADFFE